MPLGLKRVLGFVILLFFVWLTLSGILSGDKSFIRIEGGTL